MNSDIEKLRKEIHDAFAWRPYPGDETLGLSGPGGHRGEEVTELLRGKQWQDLSREYIMSGHLKLIDLCADMTPQAFVYYLPAFLTIYVDSEMEEIKNFDPVESVLFSLTDPDYDLYPDELSDDPLLAEPPSPAVRDRFAQITSSLTPREKLAVVHVLEFLAREYERLSISISDDTNTPKQALASYWVKLREEDLQRPRDEK